VKRPRSQPRGLPALERPAALRREEQLVDRADLRRPHQRLERSAVRHPARILLTDATAVMAARSTTLIPAAQRDSFAAAFARGAPRTSARIGGSGRGGSGATWQPTEPSNYEKVQRKFGDGSEKVRRRFRGVAANRAVRRRLRATRTLLGRLCSLAPIHHQSQLELASTAHSPPELSHVLSHRGRHRRVETRPQACAPMAGKVRRGDEQTARGHSAAVAALWQLDASAWLLGAEPQTY